VKVKNIIFGGRREYIICLFKYSALQLWSLDGNLIVHAKTKGQSVVAASYSACWWCEGTHNADSIIESKVIYYFEQCGLEV